VILRTDTEKRLRVRFGYIFKVMNASLEERIPTAQVLENKIIERIAHGEDPEAGAVPDASAVRALQDRWLPQGFFHCLRGTHETYPGAGECEGRCTSAYWLRHSAAVATMMGNLATRLGRSVPLWETTGLLHDLDYLKGPHHDFSVEHDAAHPNAIANQLYDQGAPLGMVLAILQHSPHLRMPPTLPICAALIACDEHSTMKGAGIRPEYPPSIPAGLIEALDSGETVPLRGFHRPDMNRRAADALLALL
jgi:hypothetical protein